VDKDTGDMTATHWAVIQRLFQREGTSIAFSPARWLPGFKTVRGSYGTSRVVVRASVTVGACVLWLFIGAVGDNGLCGESNTRAQAFAAPTEDGRKVAQPNAARDESSLVSRVVETTVVEQKQILERSREKIDILVDRLTPIQGSDATQGKAAQAPQSVPAWERTQALEHEREWDRSEALARALTSSLRGELDALRSAAEAARIKQRQALDQERERADALARELISRAELDAARTADPEIAKAAAAAVEPNQALEQERRRADTLARDLASVRAELDAAGRAGPDLAQAAAAAVEQKQALELQLKQERDGTEVLARELSSLRAELETARAAGVETARTAEAAQIEQKLAFGREHSKAETLAREVAAARKEVEERSARLAAAHAEVSQTTETNRAAVAEQKLALASERDRADAVTRELISVRNELASVRNQLEAANRQIADLNAVRAPHLHEPGFEGSWERMAEATSRIVEEKGRAPEQTSVAAVASSFVSELPRPQAPSTALAAPDLDPKVVIAAEGFASASAASRSPMDEQRLLARASALLRQADISGARPLLAHAAERGSARAAFMLAETYDARVLQSWRARGISGDPMKARELYERAQAGGIEDARKRIEALK
jgi:hypothetical protein